MRRTTRNLVQVVVDHLIVIAQHLFLEGQLHVLHTLPCDAGNHRLQLANGRILLHVQEDGLVLAANDQKDVLRKGRGMENEKKGKSEQCQQCNLRVSV